MTTSAFPKMLAGLFVPVLATCLTPSVAMATQELPPQKEYYIGEGHVDLWRGTFLYTNEDISIGEGASRLSLVRNSGTQDDYGGGPFGSGTGHSLQVEIHRQGYIEEPNGYDQPSYKFLVRTGLTAEEFDMPYGATQIYYVGQDGPTLVSSSGANGPFIYTMRDGTAINFTAILDGGVIRRAYATSIVKPNGETTNFSYDQTLRQRLRLVTSSFGFAIGFQYPDAASNHIAMVCAVNLANLVATASAPCPAGAGTATYGYTVSNVPRLASYTDAAGQTTSYTYAPPTVGFGAAIATIRNAGSQTDDLINAYDSYTFKITSQTYANGATWTYAYQSTYPWSINPSNLWTDVTSPLGHKTRHWAGGGGAPKPNRIDDPIGRSTLFQYVSNKQHLLERRTEPEGNYVHYSYAVRDNATEVRQVAKTGLGANDIVTSASYPATCSNQKTCNKPDFVIDANNNRTDYVYDQAHGGLIRETGPLVGGVRAQKRYSYAQRTAWLKNGSGSYTAAAPVWVLTQEAFCKTGNANATFTGCAVAGDEVVTTYEYGPNSGPNNLLVRGKVVDSGGLSLRTCYGYDGDGNKISETTPRAGLASCP